MVLKTNRLIALAAAGFLTIFLIDAFVPAAEAHPEDRPERLERPERPERSERAERPERNGSDERRPDASLRGPEKRLASSPAVRIHLEGTATARDNTTYSLVLDGEGKARSKEHNGTVRSVFGFAELDVELRDANGSVVKNGTLKARFHARLNETGVWHWHLAAIGPHKRGGGDFGPGLVLRGTATQDGDAFTLEGAGRAAAKLPDEKPGRTRLALDVEGTMMRAA